MHFYPSLIAKILIWHLLSICREGYGSAWRHLNVKRFRKYVYHAMAAQILGYVGPPENQCSLDRKDFDFYEPDIQGRTNLEYMVDDVLRGKPGKRILKKDATGKIEDERMLSSPPPGRMSTDHRCTDAIYRRTSDSLCRSCRLRGR